ncbi:MAG: hypothetical protein DMG11_23540 [Acidobacteria bacterium]|nr:MAG: hypothetical protein DMG11_23540 [Acidobacteriota bacterium]
MRKVSTVATVVILIGLAGSTELVSAQRTPPPTPRAAAAGDRRSVLFNWMWYTGMLRGLQEVDAVATLELQATGTIQVQGQPCRLTNYRASINYQVSGMRAQYTCTLPNGQSRKAIEVVSGQFAWDEDMVGAGLVPGRGTATPNRAALNERLIRLWSSPQGAPKGAAAGGENTKVAMEGGKPVVTFPIPGVQGAIAKATLAERVQTTLGNVVTEFTYEKYDDYNPADDKVYGYFPGHVVEKRNGTTILDLTVKQTDVGNLYVVVPVPQSVRTASAARP